MEKSKQSSAGLHAGHRDRMRQKFLKYGMEGFAPHEQLEFILYYAVPQRDTNPIAHELLNRFHSLSGVMNAPIEELLKVKGVGETAAVYLKMLPQFCRIYEQDSESGRLRMSSNEEIAQFLSKRFIGRDNEVIVLLLMDSANHVLFCDVVNEGTAVSTNIYIKSVVELAVRYRAVYAVLSHNHPSGNCMPSRQDVLSTRWVYDALQTVEVRLIDHVIVAGKDYVSLRESEILPEIFGDEFIPIQLTAADNLEE